VVVFDVLYRLLRHVYGPDHVTYVRNFTDVDDKINATALAQQKAGAVGTLEELIHERTEETIGWYHADMDALGALRPDHEPRATEYIGPMVAMIVDLIGKGHAYAVQGHVLFRVRSYKNYGTLSGRSVDDMIAGARVEKSPFKEDPMDFVLWKPSSGDEPGWDSPWGRGRPGWHIECSAMSYELLGPSFDIHGGGLDLQFPHHENEIAQSCCAHPEASFARVWMHNEMLQVEGKKMSKSLGNFFTVRDLLERRVPGEVIRFVYLSTHYRSPMDWTAEKARVALEEINWWANTLSNDSELLSLPIDLSLVNAGVVDALADDLNTALALTRTIALARYVDNSDDFRRLTDDQQLHARRVFIATVEFLGIPIRDLAVTQRRNGLSLAGLEIRLSTMRTEAMTFKDFTQVDALKTALTAIGVEVRMSKEGAELIPGPDFDPAKLEALK
jgi:cysteinyl-tRNA synthetase